MNKNLSLIKEEISKVILGKDEYIDKIFIALFGDGHILLNDVPGVGKTTLALALASSLGLSFKRIQFTPDVTSSDIIGFTYFNKVNNSFEYKEGVINEANLVLADEINRTSGKTQSALLEAMEERQVTIDGKTYKLKDPFMVIATQNEIGSIGTQPLPFAELDRFMISFSLGYPSSDFEVELLKDRKAINPLKNVKKVADTSLILKIKDEISKITVKDNIYKYIVNLVNATRESEYISLGISPRGSLDLLKASMVKAYLDDRDYVIPEDVRYVFKDVTNHRILLSNRLSNKNNNKEEILSSILKEVRAPDDKE